MMIGLIASVAVVLAAETTAEGGYVLPEQTGAEATGVVTANLSRMAWLDSHAGEGDAPTHPFTAIKVDKASRTLEILGRSMVVGANGLPNDYASRFNGSNTAITDKPVHLFACPINFTAAPPLKSDFRFTEVTAISVSWRAITEYADWRLTVEGSLGFDGYAAFKLTVEALKPELTFKPELSFKVPRALAQYAMGLGLEGGTFPEALDWTWDCSRQQDALWFGAVNAGAMFRLKGENWRRPHVNAYYQWRPLKVPEGWGDGGVRVRTDAKFATITAFGGERQLKAGEQARYGFDLYLTPFKPIDLKARFLARHLHLMQHSDGFDAEGAKSEGATVVTLHHNTVWNPYINYPLNAEGLPLLKQAIDAAHRAGLRLRCYYTTREISQNVPEFSALAALGDEIFARKAKGDATWPITNPHGPHEWLLKHVGDDIIPAWHETIAFDVYPHKLDLAVITQPDSRWNNFYLEGLKQLVEVYGLDGVYIDDSALNREALMRARRILDYDGRHDRLIDLHSWNHHNKYAGFGNSAIIYMELMPYLDQLWIGEGFKVEKSDAFWLVERSGIPFGVMSEVLPPGRRLKSFIPFLYGMTDRWGHYGHPQHFWRLMDRYHLENAQFFGYWDAANPVRVSGAESVKASVYRTQDAVMVVVADFDFTNAAKTCSLKVDWQRLGLDPQTVKWCKPVIGDLQAAGGEDPTRGFAITHKPNIYGYQADGAIFVISTPDAREK